MGAIAKIHVLMTAALLAVSALAAKPIPEPPYYYVLDEPNVLDANSKQALQTLLIEHDRVTGEQFLIAIFNTLDGEDLVAWTNELFSKWKIGRRGKDNGVLLALYWKERKARIEVGYGLEPILTDAKSKHVLYDFLIPELKAGNPNRALGLAALEVLRVLESPLIQSGQAEQILRGGGLKGEWRPQAVSTPMRYGWVVWLFLGIILFVIVINVLTSADAHFTSGGWYRPRPWRRGRWQGDSPWGSWSGGWSRPSRSSGGGWGGGGGGGFIGGGGRSGGGGASGGW